MDIKASRNREGSFEPKMVPKRKRDISKIKQKIINMYVMDTSTRSIVDTIKDIYGFDLDLTYISKITDKILQKLKNENQRYLIKFIHLFLLMTLDSRLEKMVLKKK